jgi:hypothetical protein
MTDLRNKPTRTRSAPSVLREEMAFSHAAIDRRNAERDRLVARQLRYDSRILGQARANLRRWSARDLRHLRPVFGEWQRILDRLSADEIAEFLISDTPLARRLRQSSPFLGLLPTMRLPRRQRRA